MFKKEIEMKITEKEIYVSEFAKFDKWGKLTLKELRQIGGIIGGNKQLKKEAMMVLDV